MSADQTTGGTPTVLTAQQTPQISAPSQIPPTVSVNPPTPNVNAQIPPQIARLSPPLGQFLVNSLLQICGFIVAVAFGVFAVKSVNVSIDGNEAATLANDIASDANRIALIDLCMSIGDGNLQLNQPKSTSISAACSRVLIAAPSAISSLTSSLFVSSSTPTSAVPEGSTGTSAVIAGVVIGVILGIMIIVGISIIVVKARKSRAAQPSLTSINGEKSDLSFRKLFLESHVIVQA